MENREFNNSYEGTENNNTQSFESTERTVYPQYVQPAEPYEDISSQSVEQPVQPYSNMQDTAPIQPVYSEQNFNQHQYYAYGDHYQQAAQNLNGKPKKAKKSRKNAALVAGTLALALCVGLGGGVLGSYLMNSNFNAKSATVQSSGSSVTAKTTEGKDSGLNVIQASKSDGTPSTIEEVVAKVKDSVVEITTEITKYGTFYGQYVAQGAGSGVIISEDGYIITNNHVIEDATSIKVRLTDGNTYDAKLIGKDAELDVALLKIEASNLTVAVLGTSSDLNVGETSIAIGNPLGQLGGTVTHGIISSLNRSIELDGKVMELLQTDAAINPGNSGGGLFDSEGNLIGIVVAKSTNSSDGTSLEGLGFAIPIDNIKNVLGDLKTKGYVSGKAVLGVTAVDVLDDTTAARYNVTKQGVYIYSVTSGSAAEQAGLLVGDCITKFDGNDVTSKDVLSSLIAKHKAGDEVTVTVYRDGKEQDITVVLGESVPETAERNSNNFNRNGNSNNGNNGGYYGYPNDIEDWFDLFN